MMGTRLWIGVVGIALLGGCAPQPPAACVEPEAGWIDQDKDSYVQVDDCRDQNPEFHPLAFDECDGLDNDCDGEIDEGYPDIDGDGVADCESEELCDGVDNDGDGRVDEGYDDFDGDGLADCLDRECSTATSPAEPVEIDEECSEAVIEVKDPWDLDIEWQFTSPGNSSGVIVMPAIGNLSDDNGDGVIDDGDDPDIVVVDWTTGTVQAENGDGSGALWTYSGVDGNSGVLIADIDNDGEPEVVVSTGTGSFGASTAGSKAVIA
ncbi:MAG: MopE-related protein, partial [Myxococcota bacterium]